MEFVVICAFESRHRILDDHSQTLELLSNLFQVFDDEYLPVNHLLKGFLFLQRVLFCAFAMKRWDDIMPVRYTLTNWFTR